MAVWQELRLALARLIQERPGAVTLHPDLDGDGLALGDLVALK
jgi:hypothetical protein